MLRTHKEKLKQPAHTPNVTCPLPASPIPRQRLRSTYKVVSE